MGRRSLRIMICATLAFVAAGLWGASDPGLRVWFVPGAYKVMRDERPSPRPRLQWDLAAARNEVEGCQLVLLAERPVGGVAVSVSDLSGRRGRLKAKLFRVDYVPCRTEKVLYPDPLPPLRAPLDLEQDRSQPVWISVRVPEDAAPGVYRGAVTVRAGSWIKRLPLSVRVWDFALPATPSSRTSFGISYDMAADFEGVPADSAAAKDLARRYFEFMLDHRASPNLIPADLMSPEAARYLGDARLTAFVIPVGAKTDAELGAVIRRLRDGGWFGKSFFYEVDEPITKASFDALIACTERLRRLAPDYKAVAPFWGNPDWDTALRTPDVLAGRINLWCPHYLYLDGFAGTREFLTGRKGRGEEYWWYICNNPRRSMNNIQIDMPAVPHRVLFW